MGLINNLEESSREEHLAKIITALSIAYSGDDGFLTFNGDQTRTDSVLLTLTQLLNDDIDRNVLNERQQEFKKWMANSQSEITIVKEAINPALLNNKLLIFNPNNIFVTGSVYRLDFVNADFKKMLIDCVDKNKASKEYVQRYAKLKKLKKIDNREELVDNYFNSRVIGSASHIEINLSPLCDVVQNKIVYYRLVTGFMLDADFYTSTKQNLAYLVKTPVFHYQGRDVFIGLDLRYLFSCFEHDISQKKYLFTLRTNLVNDIQTKLAAHVSRLGVLNL